MLKNRVMKQQSRSFESARKARAIADVNPLQNDVSHYVRRCNLKDFTNTCQNTCETVQLLQDVNVFSTFIACSNRNRSALARS